MNHPKRRILLVATTLALLVLLFVSCAWAQGSSTKVQVNPKNSIANIGENFAVNVTISGVQNLFGIELTVNWNASLLQLVSSNAQLGVESYPGGVLHGNRLNSNYDTLVQGDIYVQDNSTSQSDGSYHLAAACVEDEASFSGSGTIVMFTFKVIAVGDSAISVQSELADKPVAGETTSNAIAHSDNGGAVAAIIPEFPSIAVVAVLVALVTVSLVFSKKLAKNKIV
jgi:hypothetical protein